MKSTLDIICPKTVTNEYLGGTIAFYGFCLFVTAGFLRSAVHLLLPDGGINSVASIIVFEGTPNPNDVIYMLQSGGGAFQMSFAALNFLVLWRYRSLIPLMLALMVMQQFFICMVQTIHPLTPDHYTYTPPAFVGAVPALIVLVILLYLAVRSAKTH